MSNLRIDTTSIVGDLIPDVYIDNIILETSGDVVVENNPHISFDSRVQVDDLGRQEVLSPNEEESFLSIKVDLLLKDTIEDNPVSSWLQQFNFFRFLRVAVIASTDKEVSRVLLAEGSRSAQMIFGGPSFNLKSKVVNFVAPRLGLQPGSPLLNSRQYSRALEARAAANRPFCEENIKAELLGVGRYVRRAEIQKLSNGEEVRNINLRATFGGIKKLNPDQVDIIAFTYIDLDALTQEIGAADFENAEDLEIATGRVTARSVIKNGSVVTNATAFRKSDGSFWVGPVHKMPNGSWMAGERHRPGEPEIYLERVILPNISIQDFRNVADIQKNVQDLSTFESVAYPAFGKIFQERVKKNLPVAQNSSYFSDLFLSRSPDNASTLFFSFNYDKFVKDNTKFPQMLNYAPALLRSHFEVLDMKVIRRRVKKPSKFKNSEVGLDVDGSALDIFDKEDVDKVVINARQVGRTVPPTRGRIFGNSIREVDAVRQEGLRSFSVKDRSITSETDGFYQYGVEISVKDSLMNYLSSKLNDLSQARKGLNDYYVMAAKPYGTQKDTRAPLGNPHLQPKPGQGIVRFRRERGNFNPDTNRFTQEFIDSTEQQYAGRESEKPWIKSITTLGDVLYLLTSDVEPTEGSVGTKWGREIWTLCSPHTGTPEGIQAVIGLLDGVIEKISLMTGVQQSTTTEDSVGATKRNSLEGSVGAGSANPRKNVYKVVHYFKNSIFDSNTMDDTGYHYLPRISQSAEELTGDNFLGVTTVTAGQFKNRHDEEVLKYFNELSPQPITDDVFDPNLLQGLTDLEPSSFGFLAATKVTTNDQTFLVDGDASEESLAMLASNIMNLKSPPNEPMRSLSPPEGGIESWNEITTLKNRTIRDNLMDVLADKNCTIELPAAPASLRGDTISNFRARLARDNSLDLSGLRVNMRDYLGSSSAATEQLSEDLDNIVDIHTRKDGDVFNPGLVFLKLMMNFALEDETLFSNSNNTSTASLSESKDINAFNLSNRDNVIEQYRNMRIAQRGITVPMNYSSFVPQLPLQVKSLFLTSAYGGIATKELVFAEDGANMFTNKDILKDPVKMISFFMKYMTIMQIEVLTGYETITQSVSSPTLGRRIGNIPTPDLNTTSRSDRQMRSPQWRRLTTELFNQYSSAGQEMLCRFKPYKNNKLRISAISGLQLPIFDQHFLIKPTSGLINVEQTPLIDRTQEAEDVIFEQRADELGRRAEEELTSGEQIGSDLIILERTLRGISREFVSSDSRLLEASSTLTRNANSQPDRTEVQQNTGRRFGGSSNY